ncbi:hypothetical protein EM20IM_06785 [Candidatus Methylacidiphilum infernorum]|uniref:Uncharacterized protein n=1 Tax=Candidatus Methylacidiphilum infernorum TaxID=511746 RepID=A0ABX7PTA7_9BACT|nr:hypothetical protein [Candidatus Methylacidiphilum infernorum]QSR86210.1 hypothetical protein EM20IM_06785 [Candidatus Methylacidiphilum infernorum]
MVIMEGAMNAERLATATSLPLTSPWHAIVALRQRGVLCRSRKRQACQVTNGVSPRPIGAGRKRCVYLRMFLIAA